MSIIMTQERFVRLATLAKVPENKRSLIDRLVNQLRQVSGIAAVALGGSYASGKQHTLSDIDLGLYYFEDSPFSIIEIRRIAEQVSAQGAPTVTGFYEWGPWVNGGAWIHTNAGKVDFLYRNLKQVQQTILDAQQGLVYHDYDQQPTYGFYSVIYLAETQICIPLYDPELHLGSLKRQVEVYPPELKAKLIADSLWSAEFTLLHARGFAERGDVYNVAGCMTRVMANLTQALFALNERYFMRDKGVLEEIAAFSILPAGYAAQVRRLLAQPGQTAQELTDTVRELEEVWRSVVFLTGDRYQPKFHL